MLFVKNRNRVVGRAAGRVFVRRDTYHNTTTGVSWWQLRDEVQREDGNCCRDCGATTGLDVHHIIPLGRGGKTVKRNLITLCRACHERRHGHG